MEKRRERGEKIFLKRVKVMYKFIALAMFNRKRKLIYS
jgi:hypothetical protein